MRALLLDYQGRPIRFPEERWQHIIIDHSEMATMEYTIEETLADPDEIIRDDKDPVGVRLYYRWFYGLPRVGDHWICAVVKVFNGDAFVLTAYPVGRFKRSEVIWRKSSA